MKLFVVFVFTLFCFQTTYSKEITQNINLTVTENGFEPSNIKVKAGTHVILKVIRKTDYTCATEIVIKEKKIKTNLPLNQEVTVDVGVVKKGEVRFSCGMDMITGDLIVE